MSPPLNLVTRTEDGAKKQDEASAKSCLEREIPSLSIVDPVLCLRKTQSTMNRPTERLCWDPPMN